MVTRVFTCDHKQTKYHKMPKAIIFKNNTNSLNQTEICKKISACKPQTMGNLRYGVTQITSLEPTNWQKNEIFINRLCLLKTIV